MRSERRLIRFALKAPIEFNLRDPSKSFFGFATDISVGGAFIETAFPAPPVTHVDLRMWPWGWGEEVVVAGLVRWRGEAGMGVQFVSVGPREARAIHELVADWQHPRVPTREGLRSRFS
jgi:PilZ domain